MEAADEALELRDNEGNYSKHERELSSDNVRQQPRLRRGTAGGIDTDANS
jgi:hypothetical protein